MKYSYLLIPSILFFLIFSGPATAKETVNMQHIKIFDVPAPNDMSISQINIYHLDPTSQTNLTFNSYGKIYLLGVNATKNWGWWTFDLTLTDPDGVVSTKHLSNLAPLATSYDLYCQYYFLNTDTIFDLDVYTSLLPLSANLSAPNPTLSDMMQFSNVGATSTSFFDTDLILTTQTEFKAQQEYSIKTQLTDAVTSVFAWTWDAVLSMIGKIPVVGTHLNAILVLTAMTLSSILFYSKLFFVDYSETTFLTLETFILASAFCKRGTFWTKINRVVTAHIKVIELTIDISSKAVDMFSKIVYTVANVISSIKP